MAKLHGLAVGGAAAVILALGCKSTGGDTSDDEASNGRRIGGPGDRVTMCHIPPTDPASGETVVVDWPDVRDRLEMGDRMGACTEEMLRCSPLGVACADDEECCSQSCYQGGCNPKCRARGARCDTDADCCTDACVDGHCRD